MQLGKSQRTNQFLESLKAEGEVILEDVQPKAGQHKSSAPPPTDPITLTVEEKLNVTLKRDGGVSNFDVQGTLALQILNAEDGHIQVQVLWSILSYSHNSSGSLILNIFFHGDVVRKLTACLFVLMCYHAKLVKYSVSQQEATCSAFDLRAVLVSCKSYAFVCLVIIVLCSVPYFRSKLVGILASFSRHTLI